MITIFDLETTGVNPWEDRIVQIYCERENSRYSSLVNPGVPIPVEATRIHGITDEMVKTAPTFREVAMELFPFFQDSILLGYNSRRFDTIMLHSEYMRLNILPPFELEVVEEIDVFQVWRSLETQNLASAVRRWLGRDHIAAHDAQEDALASWEVLQAIRSRHDLTLEECVKRSMSIERQSSLVLVEGEYRFAFGMHRGKLCKDHPDYLRWMLANGFDRETKRVVGMLLS